MNENSLKKKRIAIALSGGGYRAATFHLGTLKRLADSGLFEQVTFISSVSGGSLVVGLIYTLAGEKWPTSTEFIERVYPSALRLLQETNLEKEIIIGLARPDIWWRRGLPALTARALETKWEMKARLNRLSRSPRWIINATSYETGKNFRFMPQRMGDYVLNYAKEPDIPVSVAVAASAGFPVLIGPYVLKTNKYSWFRYDDGSGSATSEVQAPFSKVHLWDGGVYDNLGLEALFKANRSEFRDGFDFLVVSDASQPLGLSRSRFQLSRARRLVDIATSQSRNLMLRSLLRHFSVNPGSGVFFGIGATARQIIRMSPHRAKLEKLIEGRFSDDRACLENAVIPTRLKPLPAECSTSLVNHGWEVAHLTLASYCDQPV